MWELQCSCCRRKRKGQPMLRAAWWELQELLDAEELPIPHWCGLDPLPCSGLRQCQALSLLTMAPAWWESPTWEHSRAQGARWWPEEGTKIRGMEHLCCEEGLRIGIAQPGQD